MTELMDIIVKYIKEQAEAPAQKSQEWYSLKRKTIGGSEVATVLGLNPYKKPHQLIAEKIGLPGNEFDGNSATRWGNLFETVTRDFSVKFLKMEHDIIEMGSVPGVIQGQRYSPDGIGVVKLKTNNEDEDSDVEEDEEESIKDNYDNFIVLFEFKAPFKTIPDNKVPKHYMPQILTGLLTINIAEIALFVNNCYRKCPLKDLNFNITYDTVFHSGDLTKRLTKVQKLEKVYAVGMICFYQTKADADKYMEYCGYTYKDDSDNDSDDPDKFYKEFENVYTSHSDYDLDILLNSTEEPIDFGESRQYVMDRVLELHDEKRIKAVYLPMILNHTAVNEMEFAQIHNIKHSLENKEPKKAMKTLYNNFLVECDDKEWVPIGYLPWKLVKSDVKTVTPDENWKDTIKAPIQDALKIINELSTIENLEDRTEAYNSRFGLTEKMSKEDHTYITEGVSDLVSNDVYIEEEFVDE